MTNCRSETESFCCRYIPYKFLIFCWTGLSMKLSIIAALKFTEHHGIWLDQTIVTFRNKTFASTKIKRKNNNEKLKNISNWKWMKIENIFPQNDCQSRNLNYMNSHFTSKVLIIIVWNPTLFKNDLHKIENLMQQGKYRFSTFSAFLKFRFASFIRWRMMYSTRLHFSPIENHY